MCQLCGRGHTLRPQPTHEGASRRAQTQHVNSRTPDSSGGSITRAIMKNNFSPNYRRNCRNVFISLLWLHCICTECGSVSFNSLVSTFGIFCDFIYLLVYSFITFITDFASPTCFF